jgi:hypothetical protein
VSIYSSYPAIGETEDGDRDGTVLFYRGSNQFPNPQDITASVDLALIPAWCTPGHEDAEDSNDVAAYLRLSTGTEDTILTEAGALRLYHQLGEWLMTPKRKARE